MRELFLNILDRNAISVVKFRKAHPNRGNKLHLTINFLSEVPSGLFVIAEV